MVKSALALAFAAALIPPNRAADAPPTTAVCSVLPTERDMFRYLTVVSDDSCSKSGVGCVTDTCRYCRLSNDKFYSNLLMCAAIPGFTGGIFDPLDVDDSGPAFSLQCGSTVSSGDAAVGINIVTDVACVVGGVGCLTDLCRYCKVWTSPQSMNFVDCASVSQNNGDDIQFTPLVPVAADMSGVVVGSSTRPVLDMIVVATAPPPTTTTAPGPTTTTTTTAPPVVSGDACAALVSTGDQSVGISAMTDAACGKGGLGCFSTICRFCKTRETAQSSYLLPCVTATTTPAPATTTKAPSPTNVAPSPTTVAPEPTTVAPSPTTVAPSPTTATPEPTTAAPEPTTMAPEPTTVAPSPTTVAPSPTPATPEPTTAAPEPTTVASEPTTAAPKPTTMTPAPTMVDVCVELVSSGDKSVGISGMTDAACGTGGLGCFSTTCRFCKTSETPQSSYLLPCTTTEPTTTPTIPPTSTPTTTPTTTLVPTTEAPAPTTVTPPPATVAPALTTTSPPPAPTTGTPAPATDACADSVSSGDYTVGISAYTDGACQAGGLGCFSDTCRFCKRFESPQSQQFLLCPA